MFSRGEEKEETWESPRGGENLRAIREKEKKDEEEEEEEKEMRKRKRRGGDPLM